MFQQGQRAVDAFSFIPPADFRYAPGTALVWSQEYDATDEAAKAAAGEALKSALGDVPPEMIHHDRFDKTETVFVHVVVAPQPTKH